MDSNGNKPPLIFNEIWLETEMKDHTCNTTLTIDNPMSRSEVLSEEPVARAVNIFGQRRQVQG